MKTVELLRASLGQELKCSNIIVGLAFYDWRSNSYSIDTCMENRDHKMIQLVRGRHSIHDPH